MSRLDDPIKKFSLFSHGTTADNGTVSLGFGFSNSKDLELKVNDIYKMNENAFNNPDSSFASCNTATAGSESFAQKWVNRFGGTTWAYIGQSDYVHINDGNSFDSEWSHVILHTFYWGGSNNLPIPGDGAQHVTLTPQ